MSELDALFPIPENRRNSDDMGMPSPAANSYTCGHCGYSGPCYGNGFSAPWCAKCQMNDKLVPNAPIERLASEKLNEETKP